MFGFIKKISAKSYLKEQLKNSGVDYHLFPRGFLDELTDHILRNVDFKKTFRIYDGQHAPHVATLIVEEATCAAMDVVSIVRDGMPANPADHLDAIIIKFGLATKIDRALSSSIFLKRMWDAVDNGEFSFCEMTETFISSIAEQYFEFGRSEQDTAKFIDILNGMAMEHMPECKDVLLNLRDSIDPRVGGLLTYRPIAGHGRVREILMTLDKSNVDWSAWPAITRER